MEIKESEYYGYRRIDFSFAGREAVLVFPKNGNKTNKWMLKTEYFDAFPELEIAMLGRGYHLAYLKNDNGWGGDADQTAKRDFSDFLQKEYGLARRCVCVGMSCGGFHAVCFASRYPAYVSLLYLDAPLLSFYGMPGGEVNRVWAEPSISKATGYTVAEMMINNDQPIHRLPILAANRLPVALVYGAKDTVVAPATNALVIKEYYEEQGVPIKVWCKPECDHHPHVAVPLDEVMDFIEKNEL